MSSETVSLLPCPFCGGVPEMQINGPTSIQAQHMISMGEDWDVTHYAACQCTATGPERLEEHDAIAAWNSRALLPKATAPVVSEPVAWVGDYRKSDGTTDYFVMIGLSGREMSLHMHRIRGRAEYEAAEINHVLTGSPKPEFDDFDVDGTASPQPMPEVTEEAAPKGLMDE